MTDETADAAVEPEPPQDEDGSDGVEVRVVDKRWWAQEGGAREGEPRSSKPTYVEELERQIADKDGLLTSYAAKYKEAAAEFEQARARLRREILKDVEREKRRVLASFLDVIDNLDRAVEAARSGSDDASLPFLEGVEMVRQHFLGTLEGHGVSPIDATGQLFDPTRHDAVSTIAVTDVAQQDIVVEVVKLGYQVGEEVLRPASVVVGKHDGGEEIKATGDSEQETEEADGPE